MFGCAIGKSSSLGKPYIFNGDLPECIIKSKQSGYSLVEPHIGKAGDIDLDKTLKYLEKHDMKISGISTGLAYNLDHLSMIDDRQKIKEESIKRLKDFIYLSKELKCSVIIGTMRGNIPNFRDYEKYLKNFTESMKRLTEFSLKKEVPLLIEVANRYESNYLNRVEEIYCLINENNICGVKILMDTFHMNIEEKVIDKSIREYGDLLGYFHIADSNRMYPGAGHIDFKKISEALDYIDYKGHIVLECLPLPSGKEAAMKAIEFLNKYF